MPRGLLRLLCVLVLALAVPLKGIASVTMLGCLSHGSANDGMVDAGEHAHEAATAHGGHQHSTHGTFHAADDHHDDFPGSHGDNKSQCGTCAPCCAGAALTNTLVVSVSDMPPDADFPAFATLLPSGRITRLDRPPRSILA